MNLQEVYNKYGYDNKKIPSPGCETYCEDCKSQYGYADACVDGYILVNDCDDYNECSMFTEDLEEAIKSLQE